MSHGHGCEYSMLFWFNTLRIKEYPFECTPEDARPSIISPGFRSCIRGSIPVLSTAPTAKPAKSNSPFFEDREQLVRGEKNTCKILPTWTIYTRHFCSLPTNQCTPRLLASIHDTRYYVLCN